MLIFGWKMLIHTIILDYTYCVELMKLVALHCNITYRVMQMRMVYDLVSDIQSIYELT
jgi:hypothetical protein